MKQHAFVDLAFGKILDHERSGRQSGRQCGLVERARGDEARARLRRPDRGEMALARPLRADKRHHLVWPVGKALDQRQRRTVGSALEEIVAGKALGVIERERELPRTRYAHHVVTRRCRCNRNWRDIAGSGSA